MTQIKQQNIEELSLRTGYLKTGNENIIQVNPIFKGSFMKNIRKTLTIYIL